MYVVILVMELWGVILVVQISVYRSGWDSGLVYLGGRGVAMPRFFFAMPPAVVVIH